VAKHFLLICMFLNRNISIFFIWKRVIRESLLYLTIVDFCNYTDAFVTPPECQRQGFLESGGSLLSGFAAVSTVTLLFGCCYYIFCRWLPSIGPTHTADNKPQTGELNQIHKTVRGPFKIIFQTPFHRRLCLFGFKVLPWRWLPTHNRIAYMALAMIDRSIRLQMISAQRSSGNR